MSKEKIIHRGLKTSRFWSFFKDWWLVIIFLLIVAIGLTSLTVWACVEDAKYNEWYNSLTVEERQKVDAEKEAARQANIHRYDVVSVNKYVRTETNQFGGVVDTDICYTFEYIDGAGNLKHIDDFEHLEYGLTKVVVGDSNQYIIDTNGEDVRYLQLTKETLQNIQLQQ